MPTKNIFDSLRELGFEDKFPSYTVMRLHISELEMIEIKFLYCFTGKEQAEDCSYAVIGKKVIYSRLPSPGIESDYVAKCFAREENLLIYVKRLLSKIKNSFRGEHF